MIQLIMKDGTPKRVTKIPKSWESIGINEADIKYQKELTDSEILQVPDTTGKRLVMRDKNAEELQAIEDIKNSEIEKQAIEQKIQAEIRQQAIDKLTTDGKLTPEEIIKIGE